MSNGTGRAKYLAGADQLWCMLRDRERQIVGAMKALVGGKKLELGQIELFTAAASAAIMHAKSLKLEADEL